MLPPKQYSNLPLSINQASNGRLSQYRQMPSYIKQMGCIPEKTKNRHSPEQQGQADKKSKHRKSRKSSMKESSSKGTTPVRTKEDQPTTDNHKFQAARGYEDKPKESKHKHRSKIKETQERVAQQPIFGVQKSNNVKKVEDSPSKEPIFVPQKSKQSQMRQQSRAQSIAGSVVKGNCKFMQTWGQPCTHPECQQPNTFSPFSPQSLTGTAANKQIRLTDPV